MSKVGCIPDTHFPFVHPLALEFVTDTFNQFKVNSVVHIGDVTDGHSISFHSHSPDGSSPGHEMELAQRHVDRWRRRFPKAKVCIGNHCARVFRMAENAGMPSKFIKNYKDIWATPEWDWQWEHFIDGVMYNHGTGCSGKNAALNAAIQKRTSLVMGHTHTYAGLTFHSNYRDRVFGLNVGCLIDTKSYAFNYGRDFPVKPVLGCGVVIDGYPMFVPMKIGRGEKYHRSRAGKRRKRVLV